MTALTTVDSTIESKVHTIIKTSTAAMTTGPAPATTTTSTTTTSPSTTTTTAMPIEVMGETTDDLAYSAIHHQVPSVKSLLQQQQLQQPVSMDNWTSSDQLTNEKHSKRKNEKRIMEGPPNHQTNTRSSELQCNWFPFKSRGDNFKVKSKVKENDSSFILPLTTTKGKEISFERLPWVDGDFDVDSTFSTPLEKPHFSPQTEKEITLQGKKVNWKEDRKGEKSVQNSKENSWQSENENRKKKNRSERKRLRHEKLMNASCVNLEKMNCFTHDNGHWRTPPVWDRKLSSPL